jgi:hypothetical protein
VRRGEHGAEASAVRKNKCGGERGEEEGKKEAARDMPKSQTLVAHVCICAIKIRI